MPLLVVTVCPTRRPDGLCFAGKTGSFSWIDEAQKRGDAQVEGDLGAAPQQATTQMRVEGGPHRIGVQRTTLNW